MWQLRYVCCVQFIVYTYEYVQKCIQARAHPPHNIHRDARSNCNSTALIPDDSCHTTKHFYVTIPDDSRHTTHLAGIQASPLRYHVEKLHVCGDTKLSRLGVAIALRLVRSISSVPLILFVHLFFLRFLCLSPAKYYQNFTFF